MDRISFARHGGRRPKIGLTALIDVVFMLLLFFMLATRYEQWRSIDVDVTSTATASAVPREPSTVVQLKVTPDTLEIDGFPIALEELGARLAQRTAAPGGTRVLVRPERTVALQRLVLVMDALRAGGVADPSVALPR